MFKPSTPFTIRIYLLLFLSFIIVGCTTVDKSETDIRTEHIKDFRDRQEKKVKHFMNKNEVVTIEESVAIALKNNYELELNKSNLRLAKLGQGHAFGNFLPKVSLSASANGANVSQGIKTGSGFVQMSDKNSNQASLSIQQSIFDPQAWYIYQMKGTGVDIQKIINERFKQLIKLQVKSHYFSYFIVEEQKSIVQHKVDEFKALASEVEALFKEGFTLKSDHLYIKARITQLQLKYESLCSDQFIAKGFLLETMGLAPDTEIRLVTPTLVNHDFMDRKELIAQALLRRKELFIQDKNIDLSKQGLSKSIAAFLPTIGISAGPSHSSDSFLQQATVWSYGLNGVVSLFNGLLNINNYKSSKVMRTKADLKRDMETLSIILDVVNAHKIYKDYLGLLSLAEQDFEVAQFRYDNSVALKREGLLESSAFLHKASDKYRAQSNVIILKYQTFLAAMTLQDIIGENNNESTNE